MGRKKIQISRITDERNRQVTFNKRKFGVMKKAYELSVLCDCEIALIIFSSSNKLYQYASTDMDKVLLKYTEYNEPHESLTNKNIIEKENKNGVMSPDSPEQETDYTLTPRTEAKYNKIDEQFKMVMERTQASQMDAGGGGGGGIGGGGATLTRMTNSNYTLPVSVPVPGGYGDPMLQASSPQMSHANISPRPSSSETDSGGMSLIIYQSGSMLEMSNGYPPSHSPLGGSPSPGPSPGIAHHMSHKQQSPGSQNGRASNLRVVIPTPTIAQNMTTADELTYTDQRVNQASLNTPVVTLQTPIPTLHGYPFQPQDFSMNASDVVSLPTWTSHQSLVQHSGFAHLAVSNSTSPPATSPASIKVKAEPQSPPRDLSGGGGGSSGMNSHTNANPQAHNNNGGMLNVGGGSSNGSAGIGGGGSNGGSSGGGIANGSSLEQAANLSVLNHPQQHLNLPNSRPSSTGYLTPTPGVDKYEGYPYRSQLGSNSRYWNVTGSVTPTNIPSPDLRIANTAASVNQTQQQQQQQQQQQMQNDFDGPNQPHKRPRISGGWAT